MMLQKPSPVLPAKPMLKAYGLVILAAALWGLVSIFGKGLLLEGIGALEIAFWRSLIGGGCFALHLCLSSQPNRIRGTSAIHLSLYALFLLALHFATLMMSVDYGSASLAALLLATFPVFLGLFAHFFSAERITGRKLGLISLAMLGLGLIAADSAASFEVSSLAVGAGLVAALTLAGQSVAGKALLRTCSPVSLSAYALPVSALGLLPFVSFSPKSVAAWTLIALMSVLPTYLGFLCYFIALKRLEASRAALLVSLEPVVTLGLAAVLFGERFGVVGVVGTLVMLAMSSLLMIPQKREFPKAPPDGSRGDASGAPHIPHAVTHSGYKAEIPAPKSAKHLDTWSRRRKRPANAPTLS